MNQIASRRPDPNDVGTAYQSAVDQLEGDCAVSVMQEQMYWLCELASSLSVEQLDKIHAPYTWSIRQVFEHCANAERAFGYRLMRIAAGDQTNLPPWDENAYADCRFGLGNFTHIITELGDLRRANVMLLRRIKPAAWDNVGYVHEKPILLRTIAWITAGHLHHHLLIVEQRCGITANRRPPM